MSDTTNALNALVDQIREEGREQGRLEAERQFFGNSAAVLTLGLMADSMGALSARIRPHNPKVAAFFASEARKMGAMASAPKVIATSPAAQSSGIAVDGGNIQLTFENGIDLASVTPDCFFLMPDTGGSHLGASVVWDADTKTVSIVPERALSPGVTYRVTAVAGVSNEAGFPIGRDYTLTFTTATAEA